MWGKSFHKLFGFEGYCTNVTWDSMGAEKRHHGNEVCEEEWHRKEEDEESGGMSKKTRGNNATQVTPTVQNYHPFGSREIPAMHISMCWNIHAHTWKICGKPTTTATCAPTVFRGNLKNGPVRNSRYLKQSYTLLLEKEFKLLQFGEHLSLIHQLTMLVRHPDPHFSSQI